MNKIKLSVQSSRKEVIAFIDKLRKIIDADEFNINTDITLIRRRKAEMQFSTPYTLVDLDYDMADIVARLRELNVQEYSETLVDKDDLNPPLLFVFGKNINGKQIYIKLKIKEEPLKHILCVSFHYAKEIMRFPYAAML